MSAEDDWPLFTQLNIKPILKGIDADVSQRVAEMMGQPTWDAREIQ